MLANCTSASIPLSQLIRGCPRRLLQSPGGRSDALKDDPAWNTNVSRNGRSGAINQHRLFALEVNGHGSYRT